MRQFYTRTGIALSLVNGLGQGDGVPRGVLRLTEPNETAPIYTALENHFRDATVSIRVIGYGDDTVLCVKMRIDAKSLKRQNYIGGLVCDVSNWVYRRFGVGASNPSISGLNKQNRAKMGQKELVFHYEISRVDASKLGFRHQYGECLILKQGGAA